MKPSGVEWLGEIPAHWNTQKIKFATNIKDIKYSVGEYEYIALENIESMSGKYIETDSQYDLTGSKLTFAGDVIFGKLRPYLGKVLEIESDVCVSNEFAVFEPRTVTTKYLKYFLLSFGFIDTVTASTYGTKMPRANIDFIGGLPITIPSVEEQNEVAEYIDMQFVKVNKLIEIKQQKIEKLNEYKKSLIYEYVTGKKEVK